MDYELDGKIAVVTGGTSGIGLEIARLYAKGRAKVAITGRDEKKMAGVAEALRDDGAEVLEIQADLANLSDMDRIIEETEKNLGPVDILINNAGRSYPGDFFATEPALWEEILKNRIISPLYLTQKALSRMSERGHGAVVFMGAVIYKEPIPENVMAAAAGGGILSATKALAKLMAPKGIRVNAVLLGQFDTPMLRRGLKTYAKLHGVSVEDAGKLRASQNPTGRLGDPAEAAQLAVFLSSDAASYITGALVPVDGGRAWSI